MTKLAWDKIEDRTYETGLDHGVLYIPNDMGIYNNGVAWNGLTAFTESPSGAEGNAQYADNIKYLNLFSAEEFGGTLEAFTFPDEFEQFDGLGTPAPGITIGQQVRKTFGLCYRTLKGNALQGDAYGYKLHLIYGAKASPSEKAYATVNESPEPVTLSWEVTTTPVEVTDFKPTSIIVIDSTKVDPTTLAALELILYGDDAVDPRLPQPDEVVTMFAGTVTIVTPGIPSYNASTDTITIPSTTGVVYYINDEAVAAGPVVITEDTLVVARPAAGYVFAAGVDDDWLIEFT